MVRRRAQLSCSSPASPPILTAAPTDRRPCSMVHGVSHRYLAGQTRTGRGVRPKPHLCAPVKHAGKPHSAPLGSASDTASRTASLRSTSCRAEGRHLPHELLNGDCGCESGRASCCHLGALGGTTKGWVENPISTRAHAGSCTYVCIHLCDAVQQSRAVVMCRLAAHECSSLPRGDSTYHRH